MRSTIYIVDDAAEYRLLLEKAFARFLPQYDVQFFASGDALCDAVATGSLPRPPDLLLLDLRMPGRDRGGHATIHPATRTMAFCTGGSTECDESAGRR